MRTALAILYRFAGVGADRTGHAEKWLSVAGGLVGVMSVILISRTTLGLSESSGLIASMGASAVLLFAVPHGPLSQPWPVLGGHLVSAVIGVACVKALPDTLLSAALAVALAIGAMHYLRCIHPPGGATALSAVIGGEAVHQLGFQYVLTPVLLNAASIVLIALLFNYPFPWRRYPGCLAHAKQHAPPPTPAVPIPQQEVADAIRASAAGRGIVARDFEATHRRVLSRTDRRDG